MKYFYNILFLMFFIFSTYAQNNNISIPSDTSYTVYSAYQKLINKYPFIKIVLPDISNKIELSKNIIYKDTGERKLHIDIFEPAVKKEKPFAAVLLIHGGGWRSGDKLMMHPLAAKIAENSLVAFTVEYRLSGDSKYPSAVYDLKDAVRWIKYNADKYAIDTNKIVLLGCSAGGTLAALLGVTTGNKIFKSSVNNFKTIDKVAAIVNVDGILDFTHPAESGKDNDPVKPSAGKRWFGASYKENPKKWIEASPINYVDEYSPPFLFINSSDDRFYAGRDEFINKLKKHNIHSEVHIIEKSPHTFWLFHPWFDETLAHILSFLNDLK